VERRISATRDGKATPSENPLREAGSLLLSRFTAAARIGKSYDADNQVFLKPTDPGRALLERVRDGLPYPGARPHWQTQGPPPQPSPEQPPTRR